MVARHMLAYGTPVLAGVTPGKGGGSAEGVPVYDTVLEARERHGVNTSLVYVPPAFVADAVLEACANGVELVVVITENVPVHDALRMLNVARAKGVTVIGPNCVGLISPAERLKLGPIGGDNPSRCFVPGEVGVISRSGGMTAETAWLIKNAGYGVSTAVSIGGDALVGTEPKKLLALFEKDPRTRAVVTFSEPGTAFEENMARFVQERGYTKPLICFVAGRFTETMPEGTVFGHAGAIIEGGAGKPSVKIALLREAGAYVPDQYDDMVEVLRSVLG